MHSIEVVARVLQLAALGRNACEISRETGIPRRTVSDWVRGKTPARAPRNAPPDIDVQGVAQRNGQAYAYLLGLYLGDGHVAKLAHTCSLRIFLDSAYPGIAEAAVAAVNALLPSGSAGQYRHRTWNLITVVSYSRHWPRFLPQHGPGVKHARHIWLRDWQERVTNTHARDFVRGLIHSDGCRYVANQRVRDRVYSYPRYGFDNRSRDILGLFCQYLDLLGVDWTSPTPTTIQVARRAAVARLDEFVGPKR